MNKITFSILCIALALIPMNLHSQNKGKEVVILAESDVHGAGDGYAVMAFLRDSLRSQGDNVLLASCGDFLSGGFLAGKSRGAVIRIMNAVGYDAVALGNHEFDYGVSLLKKRMGELRCPALCCNIMEEGCPVLGDGTSYTIVTVGGMKVAFVGVTTAETRYKASPAEFKGERKGRFNFLIGDSLSKVVQRCVDEARSQGASYVVLLCHLGNKGGETTRLIASLTGVTAIINGHDHELVSTKLCDAAGDSIPCVATENAFRHIAKLTLMPDCAVEILSVSDERGKGHFDRDVDSLVGTELDAYGASVIVGSSKVSLLSEKEGNIHLSRLGETNAGDFVADAFLHVAREKYGPTDVAIINGGGVRGNISAGDITREALYDLAPLPNRLYVISLSGDSLQGMLRRMTRVWPKESGSFPQISGITFDLDSTADRVSNVRIKDGDSWIGLDPLKRYRVATTDYLTFGGDSVFDNIPAIVYSTDLYMDSVLSLYLGACDGVIDSCYGKSQDRIVVKCQAAERRRLFILEGFILLNIVLLLIFMRRKRGDPFYLQLFGVPAYVAAIMTGVLWLTVLNFVVIFAATRQGIRSWY